MDSIVRARFFRVSPQPAGVPDFPELLLLQMGQPIQKRERDITGEGVVIRVEDCQADGDFVSGQFCRKQTTNIPPQAGSDGLSPIVLAEGKGIGHVAAFRYHRPTRVLLLQNNMQSATTHRIALYLALVNSGAVYNLEPVLRADALERFKRRNIRSFTVGFASPENLEALDDKDIASARGARLLAEAFHGLNLTISVSVGKKRKTFLDFDRVTREVKALLGSNADISQLEVSATEDEEGRSIDFLQEHMKCDETLSLPEGNPKAHYEERRKFLQRQFAMRSEYLTKLFGPKKK
ncbi:hypothetical protein ACVWXO_008006 [Bradyrhizobium sp. LM2.7]